MLVSVSVPLPIFSMGRGPLSSEIAPAWVAEPVSTWNWVVLESTTTELLMVTPLA